MIFYLSEGNHGHIHGPEALNFTRELTEHERKHLELHEKHRGHEGMHIIMLLILLGVIMITQIALVAWKKKHNKSYQNISMFIMWLFPLFMCIYNHWFRFVAIWLALSLLSLALIWRPLINNRMSGSTPRLIYRWFYYIYSISSILTVSGYTILMSTILGINLLIGLKPQLPFDIGFLLMFYGIYWGVLTRDFTDFLVDILTANIGYYSPSSSLPSKQLNSSICAICGRNNDGIPVACESMKSESAGERSLTLSCGHKFHEYCIYGWCLVGKKQICPFCREKVDTRKLFSSLPFQKPHYLYGNLLDFIRYFLAWLPLIIFVVQGFNYMLGLE